MKLGVIMDPISKILVHHDGSFALLLEAQRRNSTIFYMEQRDIFLKDDRVWARMRPLQVADNATHWYQFGAEKIQELHELDVILMRKDPPVDNEYVYVTQLLDLVEKTGTVVVNKPQSLRDFNEKLFISHFPHCCVPTLVTCQAQQVRDFLAEHKEIICKPLHSMGGNSIFRMRQGDSNINVIIETLTQNGTCHMQVQRFIPEVKAGDKRIFLIDGKPVPYALLRTPAPGEIRANMAAGGKGTGIVLTERDYWICEQIGPFLREKGLLFVGIDVIGDYLTEINITSPTGLRELDAQYGINISAQLFDIIEAIRGNLKKRP